MKYFLATLIAILTNYALAENWNRGQTIPYCEYFDQLGIFKEECFDFYRRRDALLETTASPEPIFKQCRLKFLFHTCKYDEQCESRQLCVQVTGEPCCAPPADQCPTIEQLGVKCISPNPTNWCYADSDCNRGKKCCPTGCGYNICASSGFFGLWRQ